MEEMQETWVWPLDQDNSLEKEMETHSSILAWRIPWTEESAGYSPESPQELDPTERLNTHALGIYMKQNF